MFEKVGLKAQKPQSDLKFYDKKSQKSERPKFKNQFHAEAAPW